MRYIFQFFNACCIVKNHSLYVYVLGSHCNELERIWLILIEQLQNDMILIFQSYAEAAINFKCFLEISYIFQYFYSCCICNNHSVQVYKLCNHGNEMDGIWLNLIELQKNDVILIFQSYDEAAMIVKYSLKMRNIFQYFHACCICKNYPVHFASYVITVMKRNKCGSF